MKVKVKKTGEIIDVHFSHGHGNCFSNENIYSDSFTGKYYYASELEQLTDNTMIDINKACKMLYAMLSTQDINGYDYVTAPAYDNVVDFVEDFRKAMEK